MTHLCSLAAATTGIPFFRPNMTAKGLLSVTKSPPYMLVEFLYSENNCQALPINLYHLPSFDNVQDANVIGHFCPSATWDSTAPSPYGDASTAILTCF